MQRSLFLLLLAALLLPLSACTTLPDEGSREKFTNYDGVFNFIASTKETTVAVPMNTAINNLNKQIEKCVVKEYTQRIRMGLSMHTNTINNSIVIEKKSSTKAELTVRQRHSDTMFQPASGFVMGTADITPMGENKTHLKIKSSASLLTSRSWAEILPAWAEGDTSCKGVGNKK